jgi:hypothetical protein
VLCSLHLYNIPTLLSEFNTHRPTPPILMPSINMPAMPAGSSPGTTHHDLLRCPRIDCPETFSEIQALINHTSVHFPPLKPRRFHHRFERGDWAKGTLERSQRAAAATTESQGHLQPHSTLAEQGDKSSLTGIEYSEGQVYYNLRA